MNSKPLLSPEVLADTRNRWDLAVEGLFAVLLAFMPLAFGAVDAWSELIVIGLVAVISLMTLARASIDRTFHLRWTWSYVPLGLFVLLAALQMAPLPRGVIETLSPRAATTRTQLLGESTVQDAATLSLYPLATAHGLRLVLVGIALFFVTASVFRTAPQIRRLLLMIFVIGCAEAALALMQIITRTDRLYWSLDAGSQHITSGSFVNYSNFSQFMNLSIGAGVALLLVRLLDYRMTSSRRDDPFQAFGGARLSDHGALLTGLVVSAVAVFASLSRNGAVSLVVASIIVGVALFVRGTLSRRGWVLATLPLGALAALLLFGFDPVYDRLATLDARDQIASRWELTLGALRAWTDYPIWGTGLGTHEFVFPMYDTSVTPMLAGHADNDYAQLLEETGLLGAVCVVAFLAIIFGRLVNLCRRGRTAIAAAAFGLALGLIAVAIHSASDFGQHVPAVFCLSAIACGLIIQLGRLNRPRGALALDQQAIAWRRGLAAAATVVVAIGWAWVVRGAYASHVGEQWWAAALQLEEEIERAGPAATEEEFADLLAATEQAVNAEPRNVVYAYWINVYRWRSIARAADPGAGETPLAAAARPYVVRIADELSAVRKLCPTFGPPYGLEGQLRLYVLDEAEGAALIRQGVRLAPYDPPTCLIAGELAARDGDVEQATALLRRTVALAPSFFPDIAAVAFDVLEDPAFVAEFAADDPNRLAELADIAAAREGHADLAARFRREADESLRRRAKADVASAQELATLAAIESAEGHHAEAADLYRRALMLQYGQIEWRLARARALVAAGDAEQAMREARTCLNLRPTNAAARQLVEELSLRVSESARD